MLNELLRGDKKPPQHTCCFTFGSLITTVFEALASFFFQEQELDKFNSQEV